MSASSPPTYFLPLTGDPFQDEAIELANDRLRNTLAKNPTSTDVGFYLSMVKMMLGIMATSPGITMAVMIDPELGAAIQGLALCGPALEKALNQRGLSCPPCECGNCGKDDTIDGSIH